MSAFGGNLLRALPDAGYEEQFQELFKHRGVRVERIVSRGQATPAGQWYDQAHDELVVLISGEACLQIEGEEHSRRLTAGEWLMLPARCRHRVVWTLPDRETIWLALHWCGQAEGEERN